MSKSCIFIQESELKAISQKEIVTFINSKVSKYTTNPEEMNKMMKATNLQLLPYSELFFRLPYL